MIAIVDYGVGNLRSIAYKLHRIGCDSVEISSDTNCIKKATKLILPGVGAFSTAMESLNRRGITPLLQDMVVREKVPILGICLGLQLMTRRSDEGNVSGFGWLDAVTLSLRTYAVGVKVPHMGWNTVERKRESPLMNDVPSDSEFYFVHSYFVSCSDPDAVVGSSICGCEFASVIQKGNIFGTQFHPEKSHSYGVTILKNFAEYKHC